MLRASSSALSILSSLPCVSLSPRPAPRDDEVADLLVEEFEFPPLPAVDDDDDRLRNMLGPFDDSLEDNDIGCEEETDDEGDTGGDDDDESIEGIPVEKLEPTEGENKEEEE